jgi:hypothetical protein
LQVDDEIGRRRVAREQIVQTLIDEELVVVEIQIREDLVLVEELVADRHLREEIRLAERRLLTMAAQEIEELGLQGGARPIGVEVLEERVFGVLEHDRGIEARAEALRERGFAGANRTLDRDVPEAHGAR